MNNGFFNLSTVMGNAPPSKIARCGACKLYRNGCQSPKMMPTGKGRKKILILGEAPGQNEDEQNRQFCGEAGSLLEDSLRKLGIDMRMDCILTNSIICRPKGNATPTDAQVGYCRPFLTKALEEYDPNVIIPLGGTAVKSLIGGIWKEDVGPISRWVGFHIPCQSPNAWICPNFHPSYVNRVEKEFQRKGKDTNPSARVIRLYFDKYLKEAISYSESKPWKNVPNYEDQVNIIYNPNEASERILQFAYGDRPIAFDFETNSLKPDDDNARIVCASVSDGIDTIAFPWKGDNVLDAMRQLLRSGLEKYGYNKKFEQRWTKRKLGYEVRNWKWCGMLGAHWSDNRRTITGLKFQAFALLGASSYDDVIKPFLKSEKGTKINRIHEIPLNKILLYCGTDSLLEWLVAKKQMKLGNYQMEG